MAPVPSWWVGAFQAPQGPQPRPRGRMDSSGPRHHGRWGRSWKEKLIVQAQGAPAELGAPVTVAAGSHAAPRRSRSPRRALAVAGKVG